MKFPTGLPFDNFVEYTGTRPVPTAARSWLPFGLLVGAVSILLVRSFWLQVVHGAEFRERAEHNRVYTLVTEAPRGIVYDRNNLPLVSNISATDLVFDPRTLPSREEEALLFDTLLELLPDVAPTDLQAALELCRATGKVVPIARALPHDTVLALQESQERLRGTQLVSSLVRKYEKGHALAHVLGYTGLASAEDLASDPSLLFTDKTGKQGIEAVYDELLRGKPGIAYQEVNASGQVQEQLGSNEPTPGEDIQLTIDSQLQEFIYGLFSEREGGGGGESPTVGAVVVLDPRSGDVLAAASYPSFDPNAFSQPGRQQEIGSFISSPGQPLFNRFADGMYPSGSTIKPFLAAAALEEKLITPHTSIFSDGGIEVGIWSFPDWKAGGHGATDVSKALAESVNTFFYAISGGYQEQPGLGVERATQYLSQFGWGRPTGIDLTSEASGFLPSMQWKKDVKKEPWYIGDTYHLGIGQGDVLVTPLQLAASTAAIADGHYVRQPHFVRSQDNPQHALPVSFGYITTVRQGMRQAVTEGSARALDGLPVAIAGKTGTAQVGGDNPTHAWFTSFAPYDDPQVVITVLLEKGGEGDKDAVPFAKEIWQWWFENRLSL